MIFSDPLLRDTGDLNPSVLNLLVMFPFSSTIPAEEVVRNRQLPIDRCV